MIIGQLDQNLSRFYAEARSKSGKMYGRSTLLGFRHSIERHLNHPPHSRNLKISTDARFTRSNQMLDAQLVLVERAGKANVQHKPVIEEGDLVKLRRSTAFSLNSPASLLQNVWFHIVLFFCRRGREGQRSLTKSSLSLKLTEEVEGT